MIKRVIFLSFLCSLLSCSDKEEVPADVFAIDKMKVIVWELAIADQTAANNFLMQKDSLQMEATSLYRQVFAKHRINRKTFYKNFSYYESHPQLLKALFDSVSSYGNRQKMNAYQKSF